MRLPLLLLPLAIFIGTDLLAMERAFELKIHPSIDIKEDWKAEYKLQDLWNANAHSEYVKIPPVAALDIRDLWHLQDADYLARVFTHSGYTMLPGRQKDIHGSGTLIKVSYERNANAQHSYTGFFQSGAPFALMRMSYAAMPKDGKAVIGMAIMFLRDGEAADSVFAMPSLDPISANGFLALDFKTSVPMPENSWKNYILERSFTHACERLNRGALDARSLTVSALAERGLNGALIKDPKSPYALIFRPTEKFQALMAMTQPDDDFRVMLQGKGRGIKLFHVLAQETKDGPEQYIGDIAAQSNFSAGRAGDEDVFFKHPVPHIMTEAPMSCPLWNALKGALDESGLLGV